MRNLGKYEKGAQRVLFSAILLFFALWYIKPIGQGVFKFLSVFKPFMIGFMLAFLINLLMNYFENNLFSRFKEGGRLRAHSAGLSIALSRILVLLGLFLLLNVLIPRVFESVNSLVNSRPDFVKEITSFMEKYPATQPYADDVNKRLMDINIGSLSNLVANFQEDPAKYLTKTSSIITSVGSNLFTRFLGFVFSIYVLLNKGVLKERMEKILYAYTRKERGDYVNYVFSLSYDTFAKYVKSRVLDSIILGFMTLAGMLVFKIPYPGMISILIGVTDVIPYFGPVIGRLISMVLIFVESPIKSLIFVIYIVIIQQIQEKIIYPSLVGKEVGLPPILSLVSVTIGGALFGIVGMLIFMPIFSICYTLFNEHLDKRVEKKKLEGGRDDKA